LGLPRFHSLRQSSQISVKFCRSGLSRFMSGETTAYQGNALPKTVSAQLQEDAGIVVESQPTQAPVATWTPPGNLDPQPYRFKLKQGEAEALDLSPGMRRVVDLVNASQAEINQVQLQKVKETYQRHKTDTGSAHVQVAMLTSKITRLASHLKDHHKDRHSHRGLMAMVNQRRKLMKYLKRTKPEEYYDLLGKLKIRDIK